jgi:hypothetical protein
VIAHGRHREVVVWDGYIPLFHETSDLHQLLGQQSFLELELLFPEESPQISFVIKTLR